MHSNPPGSSAPGDSGKSTRACFHVLLQPRGWTCISSVGRWILYCLSHQGSPKLWLIQSHKISVIVRVGIQLSILQAYHFFSGLLPVANQSPWIKIPSFWSFPFLKFWYWLSFPTSTISHLYSLYVQFLLSPLPHSEPLEPYHPTFTSMWASKMATTSAVATSLPVLRAAARPLLSVCRIIFRSPGDFWL